jgi:hypothetical protein
MLIAFPVVGRLAAQPNGCDADETKVRLLIVGIVSRQVGLVDRLASRGRVMQLRLDVRACWRAMCIFDATARDFLGCDSSGC